MCVCVGGGLVKQIQVIKNNFMNTYWVEVIWNRAFGDRGGMNKRIPTINKFKEKPQ